MAKTKAQIVSEINTTFVTNGNIRAIDTNNILKDILDCDELNAQPDLSIINSQINDIKIKNDQQDNRLSDLEAGIGVGGGNLQGFRFFSQSSIMEENNSAQLMYSVRGIFGLFVNVMLHIKFLEPTGDTYSFMHNNPQLTEILKSIRNPTILQEIDFLVKIKSNQSPTPANKRFKFASMNFKEEKGRFKMFFEMYELDEQIKFEDSLCTTITFHTPDINIVDINPVKAGTIKTVGKATTTTLKTATAINVKKPTTRKPNKP